MVEVLINIAFTDKYTGKLYTANEKVVITKERATEIQNFNKSFITVLGEVKEEVKETKKTKAKAE